MRENVEPTALPTRRTPDVSLVMPCYNEEAIVGYTIRQLTAAFEQAGYSLELIAVDNGSWDRTAEIIKEWGNRNPLVRYHRVDNNEGYGNGVLAGLPLCTAPWIGTIPADGQVGAEDVVLLYEAVLSANGPVLGKVRRRFRMDGLRRKIISTIYNLLMLALWPGLGTLDVNGNPRFLPRDIVMAMGLQSKGWLIDAEIMVKAYHMGLRVLEFNVFARMRGAGRSNIRAETCWVFLSTLVVQRFSGAWARSLKATAGENAASPGSPPTPRAAQVRG